MEAKDGRMTRSAGGNQTHGTSKVWEILVSFPICAVWKFKYNYVFRFSWFDVVLLHPTVLCLLV